MRVFDEKITDEIREWAEMALPHHCGVNLFPRMPHLFCCQLSGNRMREYPPLE
jgi:hypothetical protein